jgi:hypothetical protein
MEKTKQKIRLKPVHSQFEVGKRKFGVLGPLVWEEIDIEQTVHKPKLKFIYRYVS